MMSGIALGGGANLLLPRRETLDVIDALGPACFSATTNAIVTALAAAE